jgi:DNA primase
MSVINEVKQKTDIVEVISDYVSLQKAGRNFKALCPLHSEKHPSFFVFPEQQTWHCFGACGTGGDVFSFIMKREGVDFGQALRLLAQRAGITLSSPETQTSAEDKEKEELFQINEATAEFYHHLLLNSKAGELARNYLSHRKVTLESVNRFHLGFSPDSWEALKDFLASKGYEEKKLLNAGLIIEKEGGGSYDRFRNRLMFPICDIQGRVIGFGARALDESLPKYINSPQTPIFDKSSSLYGIDKARSTIRQKNLIIIVEGYMDAIAAHQHGFQNVVASMGTSLTEKQVDVAKRLSKNIALALDADAAGEEATLRSAEMLAQSLDKKVIPVPTWSGLVKYENIIDTEIKVIPLPPGKDPDEVIGEDPTLWQDLVEQAPPMLDFAFRSVISKVDINKVKDKSLAVQKLLPLVGEIKDPLRQAHYRQKLARSLKVSESTLTAALKKSQSDRRRRQPTETIGQPRLAREFVSNPIEEYCLALLTQYPQLRQVAQELSAEHFESTENREVFTKWQCSPDIAKLKTKLDANLLEHLNYLINKTFPPAIQENDKTRQLTLAGCILRLQERLSKRLQNRMEAALTLEREEEGINAELAKLEEEGIETGQQLQQIFIKQGKIK